MSKTHRGNNYCVSLALTFTKKTFDTVTRLRLWAFSEKYGCLKRVVEMFERLQSGMMELEKRISKAYSTFGRLLKHLWIIFTKCQS